MDLYTWTTVVNISSYENFLPNLDFLYRLKDRLELLQISSYACQNISSLELIKFDKLKEVHVGYNSFYFTYPAALPTSCSEQGIVRIEECRKLEKVIFDAWTFVLAKELVLKGR